MEYHLIAFIAGFFLDCLFGDPYWLPHPVRFIGRLIGFFDRRLNPQTSPADVSGSGLEDASNAAAADAIPRGKISFSAKRQRFLGIVTVFLVCFISTAASAAVLFAAYFLNPIAGVVIEAIMTYQLLAAKCLAVESTKVYKALKNGTLEDARKAVSMIVGRDTEKLTEEGVCKAAVETVAENTSDGVISPMIFLALGGPVAGFFYKAVNTMDSMIGYKNQRYLNFGRAAAKLDDFVNFIPSRLSAWLMIFSCLFLGKNFSAGNALRIFRRDRFKHQSPNSAQTESACAGALGLKLAGPAFYEGKLEEKPFIGDEIRKIESKDIIRANILMYSAAILCEILCAGIIFAVKILLKGAF